MQNLRHLDSYSFKALTRVLDDAFKAGVDEETIGRIWEVLDKRARQEIGLTAAQLLELGQYSLVRGGGPH